MRFPEGYYYSEVPDDRQDLAEHSNMGAPAGVSHSLRVSNTQGGVCSFRSCPFLTLSNDELIVVGGRTESDQLARRRPRPQTWGGGSALSV